MTSRVVVILSAFSIVNNTTSAPTNLACSLAAARRAYSGFRSAVANVELPMTA
jgi:hypothetical protein